MEENLQRQVPFSKIMNVFQNIPWNVEWSINQK